MSFTYDLSRIDWTAMGALATAVAVVFQLILLIPTVMSLRLLWKQVQLMQSQMELSNEHFREAMRETVKANERAMVARHDMIMPDLVLETNSRELVDASPDNAPANIIGYSIRNIGEGPAHYIKVTLRVEGDTSDLIVMAMGVIDVDEHAAFHVTLEAGKAGIIAAVWKDRLGMTFVQSWRVESLIETVLTRRLERDGTFGPSV